MSGRRDVRYNRASILRAASQALMGSSASVPALHQEAARRTGLARATVYRHFRDQRALAEATLAGFVRQLDEGAASGDSFRDVLATVLRHQVTMRPATSLVKALPVAVRRRLMRHIVTALTPGFEAAAARGEIRPGVTPADIETLMIMLDAAATTAPLVRGDRPDLHRLVDVLLAGVFVGETG